MAIAVSHGQMVFFSRPSKHNVSGLLGMIEQWKNSPISAEHICLTCSPQMIITFVFCNSASILGKKTQHFFRDEIQAFPMAMGQKHVKSQSGIPWCSPARMMDHQAGSRGMNYVSYAVPLFQR
jgi:hypothetical protein